MTSRGLSRTARAVFLGAIAGAVALAVTLPASAQSVSRARVLAPGLWAYWYIEADPAPRWTAQQIAERARSYGFRGVILHSSELRGWESVARDVGPQLVAMGMDVAVGIGLDPTAEEARDWTSYRARVRDAIVAALSLPFPVVLDWEGPWESRTTGGADGHRDDAAWIVAEVLAVRPDAIGRIVDVPWWKPSVHGLAPTAEFGRLCSLDRYVQAYGAARTADGETLLGTQGRTASMLRTARDVEYPRLCQRENVQQCWHIGACVQGYKRTIADHRELLNQELSAGRTVIYWHLLGLDEDAKTALRSRL